MRDLLRRWRRTRIYHPAREAAADWEQISNRRKREERPIVRGLNRRVVVVRPPETSVFEQALFIVRDNTAKNGGDILREAQTVAESYISGKTLRAGKRVRRLLPLLIALAALAGLFAAWLVFYRKL